MAKRANPELIKYIEEHLSKGFDIKQIKKRLADVGHPIEAIEDAAAFVIHQRPAPRKKPALFMVMYGLVLILAISGFLFFAWFKYTQHQDYLERLNEVDFNRTLVAMTDIEVLKYAASADNTGFCRFIDDGSLRFICLDRIWAQKDCYYEFILGEEDDCFIRLAKEERNVSFCERINLTSPKKRDCLKSMVELALSSKDPSVCAQSLVCARGAAIEKKDVYFCERLFGGEKASCLLAVARVTGDSKICDSMTDWEQIRLSCMMDTNKDINSVLNLCLEDIKFNTTGSFENCIIESSLDLYNKGTASCDSINSFFSDKAMENYLNEVKKYYVAQIKNDTEEERDDGMRDVVDMPKNEKKRSLGECVAW